MVFPMTGTVKTGLKVRLPSEVVATLGFTSGSTRMEDVISELSICIVVNAGVSFETEILAEWITLLSWMSIGTVDDVIVQAAAEILSEKAGLLSVFTGDESAA